MCEGANGFQFTLYKSQDFKSQFQIQIRTKPHDQIQIQFQIQTGSMTSGDAEQLPRLLDTLQRPFSQLGACKTSKIARFGSRFGKPTATCLNQGLRIYWVPQCPFSPWGEDSPTKMEYGQKGTLFLSSTGGPSRFSCFLDSDLMTQSFGSIGKIRWCP